MFSALDSTFVADHFIRECGIGTDRTAEALVGRIQAYLTRRGIGHFDAALAVADEVVRVQRQILAEERTRADERIASPEEVAFQQDQMQGTTADDAALRQMRVQMLAQQVQAIDMGEYGQNRGRLGVHQELASFLLGS